MRTEAGIRTPTKGPSTYQPWSEPHRQLGPQGLLARTQLRSLLLELTLPPISPRYSVYDVMNWAYGVVNWAKVSLCVGFRSVDAAQEREREGEERKKGEKKGD